MKPNTIVKFNLETRAKQLRLDGKSFDDISKILSEELEQTITKSTVFRYFQANDKAAAQVIEKNEKLKAKVVEAEIDTISKRLEIIDKFLEIAEQARRCGDFRAAVMALRGATEAQDSLDERLGKLKGPAGTNVNVFNVQEAINGAREVLTSRISGISASFEEIKNSEQFNR